IKSCMACPSARQALTTPPTMSCVLLFFALGLAFVLVFVIVQAVIVTLFVSLSNGALPIVIWVFPSEPLYFQALLLPLLCLPEILPEELLRIFLGNLQPKCSAARWSLCRLALEVPIRPHNVLVDLLRLQRHIRQLGNSGEDSGSRSGSLRLLG